MTALALVGTALVGTALEVRLEGARHASLDPCRLARIKFVEQSLGELLTIKNCDFAAASHPATQQLCDYGCQHCARTSCISRLTHTPINPRAYV